MDTSIKSTIEELPQPEISLNTLHRGQQLSIAATRRKIALASEKMLKGLYLDFVFDRLNLTKHH